jgi:para-aminobenzoate synthetase component 1
MDFPVIYLNSNDGTGMLAFGSGPELIQKKSDLNELQQFIHAHGNEYLFGWIGYDVKNEVFPLTSENKDQLEIPEIFLWKPEHVVKLYKEHYEFLQGEKTEECFAFLNQFLEEETDHNFHPYPIEFKSRISKSEYLSKVSTLIDHIQRGDIYEVNFCQEYYAENIELDFLLDAYFKLNDITKAPFSSFVHFNQFTALCGSPERYIKKEGTKIISQPIKGTAPRDKDPVIDHVIREELLNDPKERAENVMIVDLVRNDLSKIAEPNSVQVDELFGIYTFNTVHQMISTISCIQKENISFTDVIRATFPMGSMTGAPKKRALELIEEHESFKRGLYSGTIGYIAPNGDFDWNVVIRTMLYNRDKKYLSCSVGSAITIASDPEKEYDECRLKVERILSGMNHNE